MCSVQAVCIELSHSITETDLDTGQLHHYGRDWEMAGGREIGDRPHPHDTMMGYWNYQNERERAIGKYS